MHVLVHFFNELYTGCCGCAGQMNSLLKQMKAEKTPQLKKYICLPLLLSPDRDEELLKLTEHRYHTWENTWENLEFYMIIYPKSKRVSTVQNKKIEA